MIFRLALIALAFGLVACSNQPPEDTINVGAQHIWKQGEPKEKMDAMLERALESMLEDPLRYDDQDRAQPPWQAYPDYGRYTIGWRMGPGEDYWITFREWFTALTTEQQTDYQSDYPTPEGWEDFYEVMAPEET